MYYSTDHLNLKNHILTHAKQLKLIRPKASNLAWATNQAVTTQLNTHLAKMYIRVCPMTRKTNNFKNDVTFVNINLTAKETSEFKELLRTGEFDLGERLQECIYDGGKVSISYNQDRKAFFATLLFPAGSGHNSGNGFSSFAGDPLTALLLTTYKYLDVIQRDFGQVQTLDFDADFG